MSVNDFTFTFFQCFNCHFFIFLKLNMSRSPSHAIKLAVGAKSKICPSNKRDSLGFLKLLPTGEKKPIKRKKQGEYTQIFFLFCLYPIPSTLLASCPHKGYIYNLADKPAIIMTEIKKILYRMDNFG